VSVPRIRLWSDCDEIYRGVEIFGAFVSKMYYVWYFRCVCNRSNLSVTADVKVATYHSSLQLVSEKLRSEVCYMLHVAGSVLFLYLSDQFLPSEVFIFLAVQFTKSMISGGYILTDFDYCHTFLSSVVCRLSHSCILLKLLTDLDAIWRVHLCGPMKHKMCFLTPVVGRCGSWTPSQNI